ncbi:sigma-54-dependent transcriptional regulator [Trichlorobacter ammonificans]|uniref:Alginate biosynthesis transcriptional regulatory protein AlgB n=1 Tax=Trichlorobacter ammonificans TaxID=2916410 RepID=A0ABN8HGR2_9BACT|nr:sigma-54 dependent transcriptional regulator [Trichlorobacter ammonificans]CAH2032008.1 putative Alginate biosynthesis transcriptional regulatory protein AlgB [Trichlorobacter ammonificans]
MKNRILLIEDEAATRFGLVRYFAREGYEVVEAEDLTVAARLFASERFDAVLLDINLPDGNGLNFIDTIREHDQAIPIIVITGTGDIPVAVESMQRGADNFLVKPVDNAGLAIFLRKTLEIGSLKRRQAAHQRLERHKEPFWSVHHAMQVVREHAQIAADSESPVLITGETGTGKGVLARWIHRNSRRGQDEFVEVNCSGLRGELLAREIFGNVRGAFTSADQDRKGLLDIADHGTLFLDEIGDMGLEVQAPFLKVLEEKQYRRLGDIKLIKSDFRLISATNRDIAGMVQNSQFRQDLLYRINLLTIHLPPLRERKSDIPIIARALLKNLNQPELPLPDGILSLLTGYDWPGNIRELKNVLERALLLARGGELRAEHFAGLGTPPPPAPSSVREVEAAHILSVLAESGGNVDLAASRLSISRATLYRRIKQLRGT